MRPTRAHYEWLQSAYDRWLLRLFRPVFMRGQRLIDLAPHHRQLWEWAESIRPDEYQRPAAALWARGGGKSTHAELIAIYCGARRLRSYVLYVCGTQEQADDHVGSIATRLESPAVAYWYPPLAARRVGKYGQSRGWRRDRLHTSSGWVVDALGLDTAMRGARLDDVRPDLIILDDIDGEHDSALTTQRKLATLARAVIPTRAEHGTVLFAQNVIRRGSIADRLSRTDPDDPLYTDVLADRVVFGPVPALRGLRRVVHRCEALGHEPCRLMETPEIVGVHRGVHRCAARHPDHPCKRDGLPAWILDDDVIPTWQGQGVDECEQAIASFGLDAFLDESQHDIEATGDLVFIPPFDPDVHAWRRALPPFKAIFGGLDFGGARADAHYSAGIVGGLTSTGRLIRVGEFMDRGPGVQDRQIEWMRAMERRWARPLHRRIAWVGDGSQAPMLELLKQLRIVPSNPRSAHFAIWPSDRAAGSVEHRINLVRRRMRVGPTGEPASFYVPDLVPQWMEQVQRLAWKPAEPGAPTVAREPIKREDDLTDSDMYMHESVDLHRDRALGERTVHRPREAEPAAV